MQIHKIQRVSEIYGASTVKKVPSKDKVENKKDELNISDAAKLFQLAFKTAKESPDIRADKVETIKKQMESGTYDVTAQEVADRIIAKSFDQYR